jgi:hypothetical protein
MGGRTETKQAYAFTGLHARNTQAAKTDNSRT